MIFRLLEVVFEDYEKSWKSVYPIKFEYLRSEMNPQFATIATPNEVVVTVTFNIDLGSKGGTLHVCIPYAMIEPIRDVLYSALQGDHLEVDKLPSVLGDILLRGGYYIVEEREYVPLIALTARMKLPTANASQGLGTGAF